MSPTLYTIFATFGALIGLILWLIRCSYQRMRGPWTPIDEMNLYRLLCIWSISGLLAAVLATSSWLAGLSLIILLANIRLSVPNSGGRLDTASSKNLTLAYLVFCSGVATITPLFHLIRLTNPL